MIVSENELRDTILINKILTVWKESVRATHQFLKEDDITNLYPIVEKELQKLTTLVVAKDDDGEMLGFMGIENNSLAMLFVTPHKIGCGIGKKLLLLAMKKYQLTNLSVNEQNHRAKKFYEHFGFAIYQRTEYDDYGNQFPILYMKLNK